MNESAVSLEPDDRPSRLPVQFELPYPEELSRVLLFVKWLTSIPLYIILWFHGISASIVGFLAFWVVLVTSRYPRGMFEHVEGFLDHQLKASSYYPFLLTDNWTADEVGLGVDYPERLSRLSAIFRILVSPLVQVLTYGAQFTLFIISFPAWWIILLTGRYPRFLFGVAQGLLRWIAQVSVWEWGLRDEWALLAAPKRVWAAGLVGSLLLVGVFGTGILVTLVAALGKPASEGEAVVAEFMEAGLRSDVGGATTLTTDQAESRTEVESLFNERYLFEGFLSAKRIGWEWNKTSGQPDSLFLEGGLVYEQPPKGTFSAFLLKLGGEWKIRDLNIDRSPQ